MSVNILKNALAELKMSSNVESSAIISNEGILVTSDMDSNVHAESFAAMTAVVCNTALLSMQAIGNNSINRLIIENNDGSQIVTMYAGSKAMITAVINSNENMDSNIAELEKAADIVRSYFG